MKAKLTLGPSQEVRSDDVVVGSRQTKPVPKRILIVEDHDLFRAVLGVVMQQHANFEDSVQAGSLAEARRELHKAETKVDLAIVDLDLRGAEAFKLIEELHGAGVPIVALTTNRNITSDTKALDVGASEVLTTTAPIEEIITVALRLTRG